MSARIRLKMALDDAPGEAGSIAVDRADLEAILATVERAREVLHGEVSVRQMEPLKALIFRFQCFRDEYRHGIDRAFSLDQPLREVSDWITVTRERLPIDQAQQGGAS